MKNYIKEIKDIIKNIILKIYSDHVDLNFIVEKTKEIKFGNYSSNISMVIAGKIKESPFKIGNRIIEKINSKMFKKIEVVHPGFLNFYFSDWENEKIVNEILILKENCGQYSNNGEWINIEYVSANPTGYLHLGHARNAAVGSTISNVLKKYGYNVDSEYYVNDAGKQIDILGVSVLVRYLELYGINKILDESFYQGKEPFIIASFLKKTYCDKFINTEFYETKILNEEHRNIINNFSKYFLLEIIKNTLNLFNVNFDIFYHESEIYIKNLIPSNLKKMINDIYLSDGALWLNTQKYGDDKDRVIIKSDSSMTYFTPDIIYHLIKLSRRKYVKIIDILGADHGGYEKKMQAAIKSSGNDANLSVITLQMIKLLKNGSAFKMSKRSGVGITMMDLIDTIGCNASRWYLLSQDTNSHLEIDVEKCTKKDSTNNFYYIIHLYLKLNKIINIYYNSENTYEKCTEDILYTIKEVEIIDHISFFNILIENVAKMFEIQKIGNYIYSLAVLSQSYLSRIDFNSTKIMEKYKLDLILSIKWVLYSGLNLLGINPDKIENN
ncbi:MAG: arginine--tRNA ligase [Mycoplasmoidaceae bacterium]